MYLAQPLLFRFGIHAAFGIERVLKKDWALEKFTGLVINVIAGYLMRNWLLLIGLFVLCVSARAAAGAVLDPELTTLVLLGSGLILFAHVGRKMQK